MGIKVFWGLYILLWETTISLSLACESLDNRKLYGDFKQGMVFRACGAFDVLRSASIIDRSHLWAIWAHASCFSG